MVISLYVQNDKTGYVPLWCTESLIRVKKHNYTKKKAKFIKYKKRAKYLILGFFPLHWCTKAEILAAARQELVQKSGEGAGEIYDEMLRDPGLGEKLKKLIMPKETIEEEFERFEQFRAKKLKELQTDTI